MTTKFSLLSRAAALTAVLAVAALPALAQSTQPATPGTPAAPTSSVPAANAPSAATAPTAKPSDKQSSTEMEHKQGAAVGKDVHAQADKDRDHKAAIRKHHEDMTKTGAKGEVKGEMKHPQTAQVPAVGKKVDEPAKTESGK